MTDAQKVLILGGTAEARALARDLAALPRLEVITSLAGVTRNPELPPGRIRRGGFGGASGLRDYLNAERIAALVDATHPYAARISANAAEACAAARLPRLQLLRPPWRRDPEDHWIELPDTEAAAEILPSLGKKIFITSGRQGIGAFAGLASLWFLIRLIDPPDAPLPLPHYEVTPGRAPFSPEAEQALLHRHGIDALISKNSGGGMTYAKIAAARNLGLPVVMLQRPAPPTGDSVADPDAAAAWVESRLGLSDG